MKVILGNIKWWRFKMVFILLVCTGSSILALPVIKNDKLISAYFWIVLIFCAMIIESSWIKSYSYEIYVENKDTEICIKKKKKEYVIQKSEIKDVLWKKIRFGGRWFDTVGYRLIVIADRKYVFDSVVLDEERSLKDHNLEKLLKIFQENVQ